MAAIVLRSVGQKFGESELDQASIRYGFEQEFEPGDGLVVAAEPNKGIRLHRVELERFLGVETGSVRPNRNNPRMIERHRCGKRSHVRVGGRL